MPKITFAQHQFQKFYGALPPEPQWTRAQPLSRLLPFHFIRLPPTLHWYRGYTALGQSGVYGTTLNLTSRTKVMLRLIVNGLGLVLGLWLGLLNMQWHIQKSKKRVPRGTFHVYIFKSVQNLAPENNYFHIKYLYHKNFTSKVGTGTSPPP